PAGYGGGPGDCLAKRPAAPQDNQRARRAAGRGGPRASRPEETMRYTLMALACAALLGGGGARGGEAPSGNDFLNPNNWEGLKEYWTVRNGEITGATPEGLKFNTFLCSKKKYTDFELSFQVRLKGGQGNSGVQIRSEIANREHLAV